LSMYIEANEDMADVSRPTIEPSMGKEPLWRL